MEFVTKNAEETKDLGRKVATNLIGRKADKAIILALSGELGAGKTTFVQGLAEGFGVMQRIISPSFILLRSYVIPTNSDHQSLITNFYHLDLYRLESDIGNELKNIGINDTFANNENVVAVEWAEKARDIFPKDTIWIEFENLSENKRKITYKI